MFLVLRIELDDLRFVGVRPRAEDDVADNAEDGGIGADAKGEGQAQSRQ